jgi:hypothetical protein
MLARLSAVVTLLLLAMAGNDVAAKRKRKHRGKKKRKKTTGPSGASTCAPSCAGKACGGNGCGGSCGSCPASKPSCASGKCRCTARSCPVDSALVCKERKCVDGDCATVNSENGAPGPNCQGPQQVCQNGACVCIPNCGGGTICGDDGCGGTCRCDDSAFCNEGTCVACDPACPAGQRCVHGTCTCDPFNNTCPNEIDGQCTCGAIVADVFTAACVDRNSACDLDKPCDSNEDCPLGSVCLRGCADPPATNPNRCSKPCIPV